MPFVSAAREILADGTAAQARRVRKSADLEGDDDDDQPDGDEALGEDRVERPARQVGDGLQRVHTELAGSLG